MKEQKETTKRKKGKKKWNNRLKELKNQQEKIQRELRYVKKSKRVCEVKEQEVTRESKV